MSEVMRWKLKGFIPGVEGVSKALFQPWVVPAEDFDRLNVEREALQQRVVELERALGGMLFAFDDGVGREWSAPLLDFARKVTPAVEFKAVLNPAAECPHCDTGKITQKLDGFWMCNHCVFIAPGSDGGLDD